MAHRIWLHGLGQGPESWQQTLDRLPQGEEHCPALFSLTESPVTYNSIYAGLCRYCDGLEGPLHLCGLSLGSVLGLHYAAEHPLRVASLALISPQYRMPRRLLALQDLLFRLMPERSFRELGLP
mgnify:CR=1 FL=1